MIQAAAADGADGWIRRSIVEGALAAAYVAEIFQRLTARNSAGGGVGFRAERGGVPSLATTPGVPGIAAALI